MRRSPPPLRVTSPPPSRTTRALVLTTLAVRRITIVTGSGPQRNAMTPPRATARTTARDVQLSGVPVPTQRSGWEASTARASFGTGTGPGVGAAAGAGAAVRTSAAATAAPPRLA